MQMVAASKMRRAQEATTASRPYAEKLREVLGGLVGQGAADPDLSHPLLERRPVNNVLLLTISPDRGLAGGMPGNLSRASGEFLRAAAAPAPGIGDHGGEEGGATSWCAPGPTSGPRLRTSSTGRRWRTRWP